MRAILINPLEQSITEVEYNGDFRNIYEHLKCDTFDVVRLNNKDDVFVDDNGLLTFPNPHGYFIWMREDGKPYGPLAGRGLILGLNHEGESIATDMSLDEVKRKVRFMTALEVAVWAR